MLVQPPDQQDPLPLGDVQPSAWTNPVPRGRYNLVAIGSGAAGMMAALDTAALGGRSALIARQLPDADYLNHGCLPRKALFEAARALYRTTLGDQYGFRLSGPVQSDFAAVMSRLRHLRDDLSHHDSPGGLPAAGVDTYFGQARFIGSDRIEVDGRELTFRRAVIAPGSRPMAPDIPGIGQIGCLTSETLFSLADLPRRFIVIGGGPVGCELAQAFRRFGSEVHLVHRGDRLLNPEEPEASRLLQTQLEREGIYLHLGWSTEAAEIVGDAKGLLIVRGGEKKKLLADAVLAATGRRPEIEELGLEAAGVRHTADGIEVDDQLRTSNRAIYAADNFASPCMSAHAAQAVARLCLQNALFFGRRRMSKLVVPRCIYSDPQIAQVGLTAHDAARRGIAIDTYRIELADLAHRTGDGEGLVIVHTRRGSGRVVGGTIVAASAGETIGELTLLMTRGLTLSALARTIHCHATEAEALKRIAASYTRTRLTPFLAGLARRWLRWRR